MLRGVEADALAALSSAAGPAGANPSVDRLTARKIIAVGPGPAIAPISAPAPAASALELAGRAEPASALEIARYRAEASIRLRLQGLGPTIAHWRNLRSRYRLQTADGLPEPGAFARGYAAARVHLPWRRLCVPDSLALARFLWARGIAGDLLFGVRLDPFAAHAWVQFGELVLSDNVNVVADYTPVFRL
ncbi:lasso peptide biosynthesis B2 protein [Sphingopyxis sp.]|uniref:lasso peptide biosynthesis B2 protein n=1 Tax=Sphingopyxis sp. TaxID=1908224 RepID=UPI0035B05946